MTYDLARVIAAELPLVHILVSDGNYSAAGDTLATAVRSYLLSEERVEAAAYALWAHDFGNPDGTPLRWSDCPCQDYWRIVARAALTAAIGEDGK